MTEKEKAYQRWRTFKNRPNGICDSWLDFNSFYDWYKSLNLAPFQQIFIKDKQLESSPSNCFIMSRDEYKKYRRLYLVWSAMVDRCTNQENKKHHNYGKRGITVCDEWLTCFYTFYSWAIQNGYKEGLEIDRTNNNGPYSPKNCRFVTRKQNMQNTRTNTNATIDGITKCLSEWVRCGNTVSRTSITKRMRKGMSPEEAITTPPKGNTSI